MKINLLRITQKAYSEFQAAFFSYFEGHPLSDSVCCDITTYFPLIYVDFRIFFETDEYLRIHDDFLILAMMHSLLVDPAKDGEYHLKLK